MQSKKGQKKGKPAHKKYEDSDGESSESFAHKVFLSLLSQPKKSSPKRKRISRKNRLSSEQNRNQKWK